MGEFINPVLDCRRIDQLIEKQMNLDLVKDCVGSSDGNSENLDEKDIRRAVKWLLERHSAVFESSEHLKEVALCLKKEERDDPPLESTPIRKRLRSGRFEFDEVPRARRFHHDSGFSSDSQDTRSSFSSQMSVESNQSFSRQDSRLQKQFSTTSQMSIDEGIFTPSPVRQSSIQTTASTEECIKCTGQPRNTFFLPCGHRLLCVSCASPVKKCPLTNCARYIAHKIRFFRLKYQT